MTATATINVYKNKYSFKRSVCTECQLRINDCINQEFCFNWQLDNTHVDFLTLIENYQINIEEDFEISTSISEIFCEECSKNTETQYSTFLEGAGCDNLKLCTKLFMNQIEQFEEDTIVNNVFKSKTTKKSTNYYDEFDDYEGYCNHGWDGNYLNNYCRNNHSHYITDKKLQYLKTFYSNVLFREKIKKIFNNNDVKL